MDLENAMSERQLQFRVGVFVICAMIATGTMAFQFGSVKGFWEHPYQIVIEFDAASGIHPSTSVRKHGIRIGEVSAVNFSPDGSRVRAVVDIDEDYPLREDAKPQIVRTLLGDTSIEFIPGRSRKRMKAGTVLKGEGPPDPMETVARLERRLSDTVVAIEGTSREWQKVGQNINGLVETNRGNLGTVVEKAAESLDEFSTTMRTANQTLSSANEMLSDPEHRKHLEDTLRALPELLKDTRETIAVAQKAIGRVDESLATMNAAAKPLAQRSESIATQLDDTLKNLSSASREVNRFVAMLESEDGTLQKLVKDPALYENLNRSAQNLAILMRNVDPVVKNLAIFSDKVARHPEIFGLSGALKGSSGLKEAPQPNLQPVRQTSGKRGFLDRN